MSSKEFNWGTGRRKTAVARVRLFHGEGPLVVNGRPFDEVFSEERLRRAILGPLMVTNNLDRFNATIKVAGGGISGQAEAIRHGIARALVEVERRTAAQGSLGIKFFSISVSLRQCPGRASVSAE